MQRTVGFAGAPVVLHPDCRLRYSLESLSVAALALLREVQELLDGLQLALNTRVVLLRVNSVVGLATLHDFSEVEGVAGACRSAELLAAKGLLEIGIF